MAAKGRAVIAMRELPEPTFKSERLFRIVLEDMRRTEAGLPSICAKCEKEIPRRFETFRCTECMAPFHRDCATAHFQEDDPWRNP